jgi:thymidylate synthase (FAD)
MNSNSQQVEGLRWKKFPVGSDGFVCLVDCMGDDAAVTQAARVSYGNDAREEGSDGSGDRNLIRYLMRHRHTTPFEMAEVKLLVRVPMDCWRQWIRHRVANVNEYSTRYQPAIDSMAVTAEDEWRLQASNNKQGSDGILREWPEEADISLLSASEIKYYYNDEMTAGEFLTQEETLFHAAAEKLYKSRLELGVAREVARKDLPLSTYTEAYWKCDLHGILHFLGLRMDSHAQKEIRDYATIIGEQIIAPLFPEVWSAFKDYRLDGMFLTGLDKHALHELLLRTKGRVPALYAVDVMQKSPEGFPEGWGKEKCRERDEFIAKMISIGMVID